MIRVAMCAAFIAMAGVVLAFSPPPDPNPYRAIDGDTLESATGERIRIWGIDAPEMSEAGGPQAKRAMAGLISSMAIRCEKVNTDRYGRTVARCYNRMNNDLACAMVAMGHAEDWPRYSGGFYARCER